VVSVSDTIDIPQVGPVKKSYVTIGLAVSAGIVGYAYIKHRKSSTALQQSGADAQYAVDQATTPGNYASGSTTNSTVSTTLAGQLPTDNATWFDVAVQKLGDAGYDRGTVTAAIALWEAHKPLTQDQANIVAAARAAVGEDPPVGGPYPVTIQTTGSGSGASGVPPTPHIAFQSSTANRYGFTLVATGSPTATSYVWHVGPGTLTGNGSHTIETSTNVVSFNGLAPGTTYMANALAKNASGMSGGSNLLTGLKTLK
jgi:hypothetical protein